MDDQKVMRPGGESEPQGVHRGLPEGRTNDNTRQRLRDRIEALESAIRIAKQLAETLANPEQAKGAFEVVIGLRLEIAKVLSLLQRRVA